MVIDIVNEMEQIRTTDDVKERLVVELCTQKAGLEGLVGCLLPENSWRKGLETALNSVAGGASRSGKYSTRP